MKSHLIIVIYLFFITSFVYANENESNNISISENFNEWQYFCSDKNLEASCEIRQFAYDSETKELLSLISLTLNPENRIQILVGLPHLVDLKKLVNISIDNQNKVEANYAYCDPNACYLAEVLSKDYLNLLKQGNLIDLTASIINKTTITVQFSLKGFTAAHKKLLANL